VVDAAYGEKKTRRVIRCAFEQVIELVNAGKAGVMQFSVTREKDRDPAYDYSYCKKSMSMCWDKFNFGFLDFFPLS
jgi:hypothetical protein